MNERAENPGYGELMQENAALRQQLAEAKHALVVQAEQLAAQAAELERLRKELARSTNYITDDCEYPHHVWFANGRHVELVYPQGRSVLNVDMQLHESFSKKDGDE